MDMDRDGACIVHGSCVALEGHGVLIAGASGRGKSALALQLMALGAGLVADDRTCLWAGDGGVMADAPDTLRGRIEARGVGILNASAVGPVPLALWVDLDTDERDRLPPFRKRDVLGFAVPLLHTPSGPHFAAAILQYLRAGRSD